MATGEVPRQGMQMAAVIAGKDALPDLLESLQQYGTVFGPVRKNSGAVFSAIDSCDNLFLDYSSTVLSPKKYLLPPMESLFSVRLQKSFEAKPSIPSEKQVIFGVHSCDLNAIALLDKVYEQDYVDQYYRARRESTMIVALTCDSPHDTCFCTSMGTGPSPGQGYDLLLTDLGNGYLLEVGSPRGADVVESLNWAQATDETLGIKKNIVDSCVSRMPKAIANVEGLRQHLNENFNHPYWAKLKDECLGCGNCALSCPTCYCYNVIDNVSLDTTRAERVRTWDVCLLLEFAEVHGGNFRKERDARIKQFTYHKLSYWIDQYGTYGCVGCGRCIAACPAKIDITQTVDEIRG